MKILDIPNLLLIAGTGRNSGKTTIACSVIKKFSALHPIIAVKISPHFHDIPSDLYPAVSESDLYIAEETDPGKPKDSSRMLAAGARKALFIMCSDNRLQEAITMVLSTVHLNEMIVCESGGLRDFVTPGVFLMATCKDHQFVKPATLRLKSLCDLWITFNGKQSDFPINKLSIQKNQWILNTLQ